MPSLPRAEPLRIAVVADSPAATSEIARALRHFGHTVCAAPLGSRTALARLQQMHPDVLVLRTSTAESRGFGYVAHPSANPSGCSRPRDSATTRIAYHASVSSAFDLASAFAGAIPENDPPLVLLTPARSPLSAELARRTGALIHLIEPLPTQALLAAVQIAVARAGDLRNLRGRLARKREVVLDRPAVERAKTILMARLGLTEEEAHRRLQLESRHHNRRLSDTAWRVIRAEALLGGLGRPRHSHAPPS